MLIATERNIWSILYIIFQYWGNSRIYGMSVFQTTGHYLISTHGINLVGPDEIEQNEKVWHIAFMNATCYKI